MGFFNKILKGIGFEGEEEEISEKQKVKKQKNNNNVTASFNLQELTEDGENKIQENVQENDSSQTDITPNLGIEVIKLLNQTDAQSVVLKIKNGQKIIINLENLSGVDITRSLDFLTGAVYALNLSMQKIDEKIYIIQ